LLAYDRADLRAEDEASLNDPNTNLYRYLFYSGSYEKDEARSIYDILATARQLQIQSDAMKSPANGKT
jgi:hypothetical protein